MGVRVFVGFCLISLSLSLHAHATLKGTLNLDIEQARKVDTIQSNLV
jgi:hypothetical protein